MLKNATMICEHRYINLPRGVKLLVVAVVGEAIFASPKTAKKNTLYQRPGLCRGAKKQLFGSQSLHLAHPPLPPRK